MNSYSCCGNAASLVGVSVDVVEMSVAAGQLEQQLIGTALKRVADLS